MNRSQLHVCRNRTCEENSKVLVAGTRFYRSRMLGYYLVNGFHKKTVLRNGEVQDFDVRLNTSRERLMLVIIN